MRLTMFSPRRRVLVRRAWKRLLILGILSVTSLLATIGSPNLPLTWLQPIQFARAQSDTATPTVIPQLDAPPSPTVGLGAPPLTLQSSASVARAVAGEQFSFTTTIAANSVEPRAVELRANIDAQLELISVSGGSCGGGTTLSCNLKVQSGLSATIVVAVRVRASAASSSQLVYQALAQDDLSNTAASDQVVVTIAIPPSVPTTPPEPAPSPTPEQSGASLPVRPTTMPTSRPARPAPTAVPATANPAPQNTTTPPAIALPTVPAAIMRSSAGAATIATPADGAVPADSWLILAPSVPAPDQAIDPGPPAPVMPEQEVIVPAQAAADTPVAVQQRQIVQLPNTAAAPPMAGLVALLLSLTLMIHGLRRVR